MNVPKETRISEDQRKFEKKQWQEKAPKVHINTKTKKSKINSSTKRKQGQAKINLKVAWESSK